MVDDRGPRGVNCGEIARRAFAGELILDNVAIFNQLESLIISSVDRGVSARRSA
jgi:hypothetical protein